MVRCIVGLLLVSLFAGYGLAADPAADFFETKIRPVLVRECYSCHSEEAKKAKGGLRLDSRAALLAGGDTGPAIVPGKPGESLLLKALQYDELQMPPKGKLSAAIVGDFQKWIADGAVDPRDGSAAKKPKIDISAGKNHWAYQPLKANSGTIDTHIHAAWKSAGLTPSPRASRAELLRRVTFDLTGLPPTPEELAAFEADTDSQAWAKVVDRLLASRAFAERWGRHWLDIVRFAESITLRGTLLPGTWRYRDYVIDTFHADRPIDQFLKEQLAGDLLPAADLATRRRQQIATQFLLMGNSNLEEQDKKLLVMDMIDEQIDVFSKAFLAQTISCARCHDHKFDPIPTHDYYALAGIFASTNFIQHANVSNLLTQALPLAPEIEEKVVVREKQIAALKAKLAVLTAKSGTDLTVAGALALSAVPGVPIDENRAKAVGEWTKSTSTKTFIGEGYLHDGNTGKGEKTLTFTPDLPAAGRYAVWLAYNHDTSRAKNVPVTILAADGNHSLTVDQTIVPPLHGRFVSLGTFPFEKGTVGYLLLSNEGTNGHVTADAVVFVPENAPKPASNPKTGTSERATIEAELKKLQQSGPAREMILAIQETGKPVDFKIHLRGSLANLGALAPRGVLSVATVGSPPAMPSHQSGRLQLAEWLTDRRHPLTARVYVNRTWHWLFGAGLVRSVDHFGTTGENPSHPELLDSLSLKFMNQGWSTKKLIREIVLSDAYQRSTASTAEQQARDPDNRLLARAHRRRLDAESLRDAMLQTSGQLIESNGGPAYDKYPENELEFRHPESRRRSVYLPVFRNSLPDGFEVFDFADPSVVVGARNQSTVAPQALYLMNHPWVRSQAVHLAKRLIAEHPTRDAQIQQLYRRTLGRVPRAAELALGREVVQLESLAHAIFASIEFRYLP
ncbi:MAG: DUF1553 domain-containing protein [Gemmataceae bacterium]